MPSLRDLRKRISSVKNTQQTTRAMKLVSAAKLRRSQDAIYAHRPYSKSLDVLLKQVGSVAKHALPYFIGNASNTETENQSKKRVLLVVISSDRGLCGGFNSNVTKTAVRWAASSGAEVTYAFLGKKAWELLKSRLGDNKHYFQKEFGAKVNFKRAKEVVDGIIQAYDDGLFDEVKIVYSEFKNAITQAPEVENFLPITQGSVGLGETAEPAGNLPRIESTVLKPDADALARILLKKHFAIQFYRMMLESQAGEHGARMAAMESATKNAGEMIRKLTLTYNKGRQAAITRELLEIISGSEAQAKT